MKTRMDGMARPKATAASDTTGGNRRLNGRPTASPASRPARTPWHGRKWRPSPTPQAAIDDSAAIDRKPGSRARTDAGTRPRSDGCCRDRRRESTTARHTDGKPTRENPHGRRRPAKSNRRLRHRRRQSTTQRQTDRKPGIKTHADTVARPKVAALAHTAGGNRRLSGDRPQAGLQGPDGRRGAAEKRRPLP
ncbi:hypothetical protein M2161_001884 [Streptomyces sp. SAI-133]|uniref:hypothetical protein n=1 Tax=unclassified Streptomyces TaxID=2593676 RepID=UPI002475A3EE|nr:hypothetical protein [Streptomyces sp. SAI-133]MDH6582778.1 hypothetical protein [Streptomyces sp. SAI-133]